MLYVFPVANSLESSLSTATKLRASHPLAVFPVSLPAIAQRDEHFVNEKCVLL